MNLLIFFLITWSNLINNKKPLKSIDKIQIKLDFLFRFLNYLKYLIYLSLLILTQIIYHFNAFNSLKWF